MKIKNPVSEWVRIYPCPSKISHLKYTGINSWSILYFFGHTILFLFKMARFLFAFLVTSTMVAMTSANVGTGIWFLFSLKGGIFVLFIQPVLRTVIVAKMKSAK